MSTDPIRPGIVPALVGVAFTDHGRAGCCTAERGPAPTGGRAALDAGDGAEGTKTSPDHVPVRRERAVSKWVCALRVERRDKIFMGASGTIYGRTTPEWWVTDRRARRQHGPFDTWCEAMEFAERFKETQ